MSKTRPHFKLVTPRGSSHKGNQRHKRHHRHLSESYAETSEEESSTDIQALQAMIEMTRAYDYFHELANAESFESDVENEGAQSYVSESEDEEDLFGAFDWGCLRIKSYSVDSTVSTKVSSTKAMVSLLNSESLNAASSGPSVKVEASKKSALESSTMAVDSASESRKQVADSSSAGSSSLADWSVTPRKIT